MGKKPFKEGVEPIKKTFCENSDSRLGFSCATNGETLHSCMLDLDHIDGDHYHNVEKNIQTLCKNCHSYKTKMNGDNRTGW
jgi:5-methylcytosine-specific restriction endonuclease McrA|tara:strand:+ start:184 stop:426 length:243 start_codon:yes stop_codon:yes gene_type:complete